MYSEMDLQIKNGMVIDTSQQINRRADVYIKNGVICEVCSDEDHIASKEAIDAAGCIVAPGLIDFHSHFFHRGSEIGVQPELAFLPQCVTTAVDQGSAGFSNIDDFLTSVIHASTMHLYAFINLSPAGLVTTRYPENLDPQNYDLTILNEKISRNQNLLIGIKVRQSKEIVKELNIIPLIKAIEIAGKIGCPVCVHAVNPPEPMADIMSKLRHGDILCHVFHSIGNNILEKDGKVNEAVLKAQSRGVLFDTADGYDYYDFDVIRAAIRRGFIPDIISTDLTKNNVYSRKVGGLPLVMSKYLNLGIPLKEIVRACSETPAKVLGRDGQIGSLRSGANADVSILKIVDAKYVFHDQKGGSLACDRMIIPLITILNGRVVYRSSEAFLSCA